jgi:hypothetical protein
MTTFKVIFKDYSGLFFVSSNNIDILDDIKNKKFEWSEGKDLLVTTSTGKSFNFATVVPPKLKDDIVAGTLFIRV